jgi:hypothetical protein
MNLLTQDRQLIPEVYRIRPIQKQFSHPKPRPFIIQPEDPSYRLVPLTKGIVAMVDTEDYERISVHLWQAHWSKITQTFYAQRAARPIEPGGKQICVSMHREVMLVADGKFFVDHRERSETLDNRKANLRIADVSQNGCNSKISRNNRSGFKGVYFHKKNRVWCAVVRRTGTSRFLGCFPTPEAAYAAYVKAAKELHGEFYCAG